MGKGKYLAVQIEQNKLDYKDVTEKFPQHKEEIDRILNEDGLYDEITKK